MRSAVLFSVLICGLASAAIPIPGFYARRDYSASPCCGVYSPQGGFVQVADVNGDRIPDIITVDPGSDAIFTLLGEGNGTFSAGPAMIVSSGYLLQEVPVDLNGDGKIDLVMWTSQGIGVFFGNGDGSFQTPIYYPAGSGYITVGDFNGDGIPDVVQVDGSGIWLLTGKAGGELNPAVLTPIAQAGSVNVVAADFNGDGHLDLAMPYIPSGKPGGIEVVFGNGDGTFQVPAFFNGNTAEFIAVGDLNGDGYPDLVLDGGIIYWNKGHGVFFGPTLTSLPGTWPAIGDVNGDGIADLVSSDGYVAFGLGHGKFKAPVYYRVADVDGSWNVVLADLRKNGLTDIVGGEHHTISVLLNRGTGKHGGAYDGVFPDGEWISLTGNGNCGAAADFNLDGKPDLAVPTSTGVVILLGTGKASAPYTMGTTIPLSGPGCPIAGDVNGDGIPDLLEGANSLGGLAVYLGNGDGTFRSPNVQPVAVFSNMVLGDFNHDGKVDIATSSNQMLLGKGDGTFQAPVPILANPPNLGFTWLAAGDVNNDGWTDLSATQYEYCCGAVYVMLNDQQGGFTLNTTKNSCGPLSVMLADLNGDGNLDGVLECFDGPAEVLLGNGKGGFKKLSETIPYPGYNPLPAQIGDVNGDGIPDILLPDYQGSIGVALGRGDGTFQSRFNLGAGQGLGQVFLQSLHGQPAGLPDLVAPDSTGGVMVLINLTQ
jgi:hypothetical protein